MFLVFYLLLALPNFLLDHLDLLVEVGWALPLLVDEVHGPALLRDVLVDAQRIQPRVFVVGGQLEASADSAWRERYLALADCR